MGNVYDFETVDYSLKEGKLTSVLNNGNKVKDNKKPQKDVKAPVPAREDGVPNTPQKTGIKKGTRKKNDIVDTDEIRDLDFN